MRTRPAYPFNKSLLAAAVIIASGCATTSPDSPDDEGFSGPLVDAGRATAGVTSRALNRAGYLLGLHDNAGVGEGGTRPPMDEVDLALLEEDAVLPGGQTSVTGADDELAVARFVVPDEAAESDVVIIETPAGSAAAVDARTDAPADAAPLQIVALNDYTHTVGATETLWEISKRTTGDATNWHALADVNDLGQNAAVYPGQDLIIPADMLRPELADAIVARAASEPPRDNASVQDTAGTLAAREAAEPLEPVERLDPVEPAAPVALASASPVAPVPEAPADDARGFDVLPGESLWEFARRTTGDATEWQVIAAHNGFDERRARTIRAGERIFVPETLVRAELGGSDAPKPVQGALQVDRPPSASGAPGVSPRLVPIAEASAALPAETALPVAATDSAQEDIAAANEVIALDPATGLDETRDITIVEASFNEPAAEEFSPDAPEALTGQVDITTPDEITISGTYYPKAVYNEADFSSSLLMRVSPGTRLRVAGVEGPWYTVETDDGTGYVHDRDIQ